MTADLRRFFGVRLSDVWTGKEDPIEVADMAAHMPRGGAISQWLGGWGALSAEDEALRRIEYVLVATNAKKKPKPPAPPESLRHKAIQDRIHAKRRDSKARAMKSMSRLYGGS